MGKNWACMQGYKQAGNGVKNFHVEVKETSNKVIFMRKLLEGGSEHSFGIHVAKMAGIPKMVLQRADEILKELENNKDIGNKTDGKEKIKSSKIQLSMFQLDDPAMMSVKEEIKKMDLNSLSPIEALMKLSELKNKLL